MEIIENKMTRKINLILHELEVCVNIYIHIPLPTGSAYGHWYFLGLDYLYRTHLRKEMMLRVEVVTNTYLRFVGMYKGFRLYKEGDGGIRMDYKSFDSKCKFI